jgi:hypothetical protein
MIDIKIGDKVTGIKGNKRVTGTVMNIKEGHVHIKAPVSGVYAPLVSIVPLHKVTKLAEGAMKRKAEAEDDGGMSDYMHDAQTSSSAPFDGAKPAQPHQDKFGNRIKIGNVAKNLAKQGMRGVKKEEVELDEVNSRHSLEAAQAALTPTARRIKDALSNTKRAKANTDKYARRISKISPDYTKNDVKDHLRNMGEDLNYRRVYEPTSAQALNPGLQKRIDDASKAQIPPPAGRRPIGKIELMTRKEEVELDEWRHSEVQRQAKRISKGVSSDEATARMKATREKEEAARRAKRAASKTVKEGYKGRKAFGSAYDKTRDPFQDSKRAFKSRELEHELAHEAPSGPAHHDQTPHDVHIDGKKWKTFGSAGHAHNVANKLSISGKRATVHKTPIAEKAPPGWEGTVKAMKKHSEIDNPYALAWWMKRKGAKSHKDEK